MVQWEMTNNGGYNTIDSVMHRDTGYLVHSQTFMCKDVNGTQYNGAAFEMAEAAGEDLMTKYKRLMEFFLEKIVKTGTNLVTKESR